MKAQQQGFVEKLKTNHTCTINKNIGKIIGALEVDLAMWKGIINWSSITYVA